MVIAHGSANLKLNLKYLLGKNMLFEWYFSKKKKLMQDLL